MGGECVCVCVCVFMFVCAMGARVGGSYESCTTRALPTIRQVGRFEIFEQLFGCQRAPKLSRSLRFLIVACNDRKQDNSYRQTRYLPQG